MAAPAVIFGIIVVMGVFLLLHEQLIKNRPLYKLGEKFGLTIEKRRNMWMHPPVMRGEIDGRQVSLFYHNSGGCRYSVIEIAIRRHADDNIMVVRKSPLTRAMSFSPSEFEDAEMRKSFFYWAGKGDRLRDLFEMEPMKSDTLAFLKKGSLTIGKTLKFVDKGDLRVRKRCKRFEEAMPFLLRLAVAVEVFDEDTVGAVGN